MFRTLANKKLFHAFFLSCIALTTYFNDENFPMYTNYTLGQRHVIFTYSLGTPASSVLIRIYRPTDID